MVRVGEQLRRFLDRKMHGLKLDSIQVDEIWTFVLKKQARLEYREEGNDSIGDQYLWVGLDESTKLIPSFLLG